MGDAFSRRMAGYRQNPEGFAAEILGSRWWHKQKKVGEAVARFRRTAVKSANGVGKTYLAADLVLWFLYSYQPSIVLTTAPTWRQVRHVLWEEIRRRFQGAQVPLPGALVSTRISAGEGWFALGLATTDGVRFQGFHAENALIIFDEASGIPDAIWEAAEGVAVGKNNRILAIGNPLRASGRFYEIFCGRSTWRTLTISALEHPNITGIGEPISGAVTVEALEARIQEWCEVVGNRGPETEDGEGDETRGHGDGETRGITGSPGHRVSASPDVFIWNGQAYRPNNLFRARVLGEFPDSDDESLIPLRWIEAAMERELSAAGYRRAAADVARFGGDNTVIGLRDGPTVTRMDVIHGADTMEVAGRIAALAYEAHPESIAVDCIGLGAGVVDRLMELGIEGVDAVNVALRANDSDRFANRRAELYWGLRERFRTGEIAIPRDDELRAELASIQYGHSSRGQIQIQSKEEMKKRGLRSPDRADMLTLLFDGAADSLFAGSAPESRASAASALRAEMESWG